MSFIAKVAAIKDALGLPCDILGALPIVTAANALMGIVLEPSTPLPSMVDELCAALVLRELTPTATAAPAAASSAAPRGNDTSSCIKGDAEAQGSRAP